VVDGALGSDEFDFFEAGQERGVGWGVGEEAFVAFCQASDDDAPFGIAVSIVDDRVAFDRRGAVGFGLKLDGRGGPGRSCGVGGRGSAWFVVRRRRLSREDRGRVFGQIPTVPGHERMNASLLTQFSHGGGQRVEAIAVAGAAGVGEAAGDGQVRPRGSFSARPSILQAIETADGKQE